MVSAINSALSGIDAAERRIQNSANNIANQFSTRTIVDGQVTNQPFVPQRIQQVSGAGGSVLTVRSNVEPATVAVFDPSNPEANAEGIVQFPNVDVAQELVSMQIASYDFKANLKTIKVEDNMQKSLLDIIS
jgi:flagellar basal-body rod protein FlgC